MTSSWGRTFVAFFIVWMVAVAAGLWSIGLWDPVTGFLLGFTGFLLALEVSAPTDGRPATHRRLRWLALVGFAGVVYVIIDWIQSLLV